MTEPAIGSRSFAAPAPQRATNLDGHPRGPELVADRQRLDCARRSRCLLVASRADWRSFTCRGCDAYTPPDADALACERVELAAFGRFVVDCGEQVGRRAVRR